MQPHMVLNFYHENERPASIHKQHAKYYTFDILKRLASRVGTYCPWKATPLLHGYDGAGHNQKL